MSGFMFATGIENSYPTIAGGVRVDEMDKCGHYARWREDLALVREVGATHLRWGPALYKTFTAPGRYEWGWTDDVLAQMRELELEPIIDLCHFGVPDWLGNFQNQDFPRYFAEYAGAFAQRYPRITLWTPMNEILITAMFSARYGWWNERLQSERAFVRALANCCKANVLAMQAIRRHVPKARFVQSESIEYTHAAQPDLQQDAVFHNERRFLPLDLTYGRQPSAAMRRYLAENGLSDEEYAFFMSQKRRAGCILGLDYYVTNEHLLKPGGGTGPSGEVFGLCLLAKEYYDRYRLPMMHTETNLWENQNAAQWLWKQWHCLMHLRAEGLPILGFTWYSLTDQMDWDTALREDARRPNPVGLYDLDRKIRGVGKEYQRLVKEWSEFVAPAPIAEPLRRAA